MGASQVTYQNGYAQTTYGNPSAPPPPSPRAPVTYTPDSNGASAPTQADQAPTQIQTTPVPLGEPPPQQQPTPSPSVSTLAPQPAKMAVPNAAAFQCKTDAQCLLGRCNVQYGRCAYPCKNSEADCKPGNVCSASGVCVPRSFGTPTPNGGVTM